MTKPVTNHQLDALVIEAGYGHTHAVLARQVNRLAHEHGGLVLKYDGASVYWWLRGRCPTPPSPELLARVLSRRIGRRVELHELGFPELSGPDGPCLAFHGTLSASVSAVTDLWRLSVLRRDFIATTPFVASAAAEAGWRWNFDGRDADVSHSGERTVSAADITSLRTAREEFVVLDRQHGGGHARTFLTDYLNRDVAPLLRGTYSDPIGRELFSLTAQLTGMVGFMSYDIGDHGFAQRAFIQSLRLAKAADDRTYGSHVLANMATQALHLHQPADAVRLANAAVDSGRRGAPAAVTARLYNTAACAHAATGDARATTTALRSAEHAMQRSDAAGAPDWVGFFSPAHLAGTHLRCLRDLGKPREALRFAEASLQLPQHNVRTRALHTALVATVHADLGNVDHACAIGHEAIELTSRLRSRRAVRRVTDVTRRLAAHRDSPVVDDLIDHARTLTA